MTIHLHQSLRVANQRSYFHIPVAVTVGIKHIPDINVYKLFAHRTNPIDFAWKFKTL